jgi:hypothetical protein
MYLIYLSYIKNYFLYSLSIKKYFFKKLTYLYNKKQMAENKSLVEEAIIQMKNLEDVIAENAKGILESTMSKEIKELVKESLKEQDDEEIEDDGEDMNSDEIEDVDDEIEDVNVDMEADAYDMEDDDMSEPNMEVDTIDLTKQPASEVLRVFKLLSPEDEIVVTKDTAGNINLKDQETNKEYMIVNEGMDEYDEFDEMYSDEEMMEDDMGLGMDDMEMMEMDDMDMDDMEMMEMDDMDIDDMEMMEMDDEPIYELEMDDSDVESSFEEVFENEDYPMGEYGEEDEEDEEDEEFETMRGRYFSDEEDEDEFEDEEDEFMMESKKSTKKPKGIGFGSASKFKYSSKTTDYPTKKQPQGTRGVGMGKPKKDIYKSDSPSFDGEFSKKPTSSRKETKENMAKPMKPMMKKMETKEASRTLGNGKYWGREGLPKPKAAPRHIRKESIDNSELEILREKNEEYRKALNIFRTKLDEVAIFNSNLAYATRLFTEHSTSKQEKINILQRFDGVETLKESKNLYKVLKDELTSSKPQTVNESVERTIQKSPSTGSAVNLIESKTYENPQFLRMKDLMSKLK